MKRFSYETCCVSCGDVDALRAMIDAATSVTLKTFRRNCDTLEWETQMGYERTRGGLPLSKDWHVGFYRSTFRGRPCFYALHSAIEHIFTPTEGK